MSIMLYFFSTFVWLLFSYYLAAYGKVCAKDKDTDWETILFILLAVVVLAQGWIVLVKSYPGILPYVIGSPSTARGILR
jgi:hypothetical protein